MITKIGLSFAVRTLRQCQNVISPLLVTAVVKSVFVLDILL